MREFILGIIAAFVFYKAVRTLLDVDFHRKPKTIPEQKPKSQGPYR